MKVAIVTKISFLLLFLVLPIKVFSDPLKTPDLSSQPLHIVSDRVIVDEKSASIIFQGHVLVRQADITISCDRLTVYGKKKTKPNPKGSILKQIDRIEVEGNVRVVQGNRMASSQKAVYDLNNQKIYLMGNPVVAQGKDRLTGQMITIDLKRRKSIVEGGSEKPVEVILYPSKNKTDVVK